MSEARQHDEDLHAGGANGHKNLGPEFGEEEMCQEQAMAAVKHGFHTKGRTK